MIDLVPYDAERHRGACEGFSRRTLRRGPAGRVQFSLGSVFVRHSREGLRYEAEVGRVGGFVSVEFRSWNRLGQLHGLAVNPRLRRRGVASALIGRAEGFVRGEGGRGLYADTPVTNEIARGFYEALGYRRAYLMPGYYDEGLNGVTYFKLFADKAVLRGAGRMVMFSGPAGASKSTLARAWCAT